MTTTKLNINYLSAQSVYKAKLYIELLKPRLSFLVAFSASFGYLLANQGMINWFSFFALSLGGFCISGASIIINQIIEKDLDNRMSRTQNRPLPSDKLTLNEAIIYGFLVGFIGFILLIRFTNIPTATLALLSMLLYGFVYTPLKRVGAIAVYVGAIPGALPPLLGWLAVRGELSYEAWIIFLIQFIWQFPHFWAIAWVMDDDYKKAGFKLLPSRKGKSFSSALQILLFTLLLIPVGILPYYFGTTGLTSAIIAAVAGFLFLIPTLKLVKQKTRKIALQIMFGSFIYLPIIQIAFLLDKI